MQKLADKINERFEGKWEARPFAGGIHIENPFEPLNDKWCSCELTYHPTWPDLNNGRFIVWGLERLSELGWFIILTPTPDCGWRIEPRVRTEYAEDESLAACVYNALCKALEVEP